MTEKKENYAKLASASAPSIIKTVAVSCEGPGRPVVHDPDKFQAEIVTRLTTGESLHMICLDKTMPSLRTVNRWLADDDDFASAVAGARQLGVHTLMEAAYDIAAGGNLSTGSIERDKLLCSVIKWICAKRDPESARGITANKMIIVMSDDDLSRL